MTERSEWHTPLAAIRTTTSPGPGAMGVTSSIESGSSSPTNSAARMQQSPWWRDEPTLPEWSTGAGPSVRATFARVTRLLLVRHGQSVWNADGRWQGQADPPLSQLGEEQAAAAATRVDGIAVVYSSDLVRARRTAEILGAGRSIEPVVDARLRERHAGRWEGRTRVEIEAEWPGYLDSGRRPDGYEPDESVLARALDALGAIAAAHDGDVLVVTHGGVVRTLERQLADPDAPGADGVLANLGGRWIHHESGALKLGDRVLLLDEAQVTRPNQL
jgi:probable phosphoglycerate mutase